MKWRHGGRTSSLTRSRLIEQIFMRLLFLSNYYPPHHFGGFEELCEEIANYLIKRGHSVTVLTSNYAANGKESEEKNIFRLLNLEMDIRPYWSSFKFFWGRQDRLQKDIQTFENDY